MRNRDKVSCSFLDFITEGLQSLNVGLRKAYCECCYSIYVLYEEIY